MPDLSSEVVLVGAEIPNAATDDVGPAPADELVEPNGEERRNSQHAVDESAPKGESSSETTGDVRGSGSAPKMEVDLS